MDVLKTEDIVPLRLGVQNNETMSDSEVECIRDDGKIGSNRGTVVTGSGPEGVLNSSYISSTSSSDDDDVEQGSVGFFEPVDVIP